MGAINLFAGPPEPAATALERPRLLQALERRWAAQLTCVEAGSGFGKTTALAQALAANSVTPRGRDVWARCDAATVRMVRQWHMSLTGLDDDLCARDPRGSARRMADLIWSLAPLPVCLVADDVHRLGDGAAGTDFLAELVDLLPRNGHLLLAGRTMPRIPLGRAQQRGLDVVTVDAGTLAFDEAEVAELAVLRDRAPLERQVTGGWPALTDLALRVGPNSSTVVSEFLRDDALTGVSDDTRETLALLRSVGPLDAADATELLGRPIDLQEALGHLPMVSRVDDTFEVHALWDAAVVAGRHRDAVEDWAAEAVALTRRRGELDRAFRIAAEAQDWDLAVEIVAEACRESQFGRRPQPIASWLPSLPDSHRDRAPVVLARGLQSDYSDWRAARSSMEGCIAELAATGEADLELLAIARLGLLAWEAGDLGPAISLVERVHELRGTGEVFAGQLEAVGQVLLDDVALDLDSLWQHLAVLGEHDMIEPLRSLMVRFRAVTEFRYGSVTRVLALCDMSGTLIPEVRADMLVVRMWSQRLMGQMDEAADLLEAISLTTPTNPAQGAAIDANCQLVDAWREVGSTGSVTLLDQRARMAETGGAKLVGVLLHLAAAARLVNGGAEADAADLLDLVLPAERADNARMIGAAVRAIPLHYVLQPLSRKRWDALPLGDGPARSRFAAGAMVAARSRERGWRELASEVIDDPGAEALLPTMWLVELAVRLGDDGRSPDKRPFETVVDHIGADAHAALRLMGERADQDLAAAARRLVASVPAVPTGRFILRLLGPVRVEHDGIAVVHADWKRERVRALMAIVGRRSEVSRVELCDQLWPDLAPDAAANNLRVTLSYLRRVLEPGANASTAAFHVVADSATVSFRGSSSWVVDVKAFERGLDRAEALDRAGDPDGAVGAFSDALAWYRGDLLADVKPAVPDEIERERLRSRFVCASVRLGTLLAARGDLDDAHRLAARALEFDPWSELAGALDVQCYLGAGDRAAASRALRRCLAQCDELGLEPSEELRRLEREVASR